MLQHIIGGILKKSYTSSLYHKASALECNAAGRSLQQFTGKLNSFCEALLTLLTLFGAEEASPCSRCQSQMFIQC